MDSAIFNITLFLLTVYTLQKIQWFITVHPKRHYVQRICFAAWRRSPPWLVRLGAYHLANDLPLPRCIDYMFNSLYSNFVDGATYTEECASFAGTFLCHGTTMTLHLQWVVMSVDMYSLESPASYILHLCFLLFLIHHLTFPSSKWNTYVSYARLGKWINFPGKIIKLGIFDVVGRHSNQSNYLQLLTRDMKWCFSESTHHKLSNEG